MGSSIALIIHSLDPTVVLECHIHLANVPFSPTLILGFK